MLQIRRANPDEYESILRFLSEAYFVSRDFFPRHYPSWWNEYTDFSRIRVMARGGEIESLVRIFPLNLELGQVSVSVGGIGAISTRPPARGQGHMHHLLYRVIEEMKEEFCLSILWGDRHRYRLFGYENGGSCISVQVGPRGLARMGVKPLAPKPYYGEPESLQRIQDCYQAHEFRRKRSKHEDSLLYSKSDVLTWTGGDKNHFGYLVLSKRRGRAEVEEFGGHPSTVLGLAASLFATIETRSITFTFPRRESVSPEYWEAASGWSIESAAMIKILHLAPAINLFRPWLNNNPDASDPGLFERPDAEVVERLFGGGRTGAAPFFCWPLDRV